MTPEPERDKRIVVGVDGSPQAAAALEWAIALARLLDAEVIAVHGVHVTVYSVTGYETVLQYDAQWHAELKQEFQDRWCLPLVASGLRHQMLFEDGRPAEVIADVADRLDADLIVVGRRGRGGIVEMVLGSVSHELSHRSKRPVLLISQAPAGLRGSAATPAGAAVPA